MTAMSRSYGHIVVVGLSKTGTTGVYASIRDGLRDAGVDAITLFEPPRADILDNVFLLAPGRAVLAKTTMTRCADVLPDPLVFDRRVMTVRDPRDALISSLLFRPITKRAIDRTDAAATDEFVAALERKEADPSSLSVRDLFALSGRLGIGGAPVRVMVRELKIQQRMLRRYPFHVVRYEDFVDGKLEDLSTYLGLPLQNVTDSRSPQFGHISRSRSSGDFVNWFRKDDLAYFDTILGDAIGALGYQREVQLPDHPVIDPATSSEYVRARARQRRAVLTEVRERRRTTRTRVDADSSTELDRLSSLAENGDPVACLRLAEAAVSGRSGSPDNAAALRWARLAAQLGLREGMELTIHILSTLDGDDPAIHRELSSWTNEHQLRYASDRRVAELERQLERLRRSARYRIGDQLVALARSPWHNGPRAMRELVSIWRGRQGTTGR